MVQTNIGANAAPLYNAFRHYFCRCTAAVVWR